MASTPFFVSTSTGIVPDLLRIIPISTCEPPGMMIECESTAEIVETVGIHEGLVETVGQASGIIADEFKGKT